MIRALWLVLLLVLTGCSDQRATFEIATNKHSLTLIRTQGFFWEKSAKYAVVATRMPDCMRKHSIGPGNASTRIEVYAPGNDAWIFKQGKRMFVVETRTCEGFAKLETEPESGMGTLQGVFQLRNSELVFVAAKPGEGGAKQNPDGAMAGLAEGNSANVSAGQAAVTQEK